MDRRHYTSAMNPFEYIKFLGDQLAKANLLAQTNCYNANETMDKVIALTVRIEHLIAHITDLRKTAATQARELALAKETIAKQDLDLTLAKETKAAQAAEQARELALAKETIAEQAAAQAAANLAAFEAALAAQAAANLAAQEAATAQAAVELAKEQIATKNVYDLYSKTYDRYKKLESKSVFVPAASSGASGVASVGKFIYNGECYHSIEAIAKASGHGLKDQFQCSNRGCKTVTCIPGGTRSGHIFHHEGYICQTHCEEYKTSLSLLAIANNMAKK